MCRFKTNYILFCPFAFVNQINVNKHLIWEDMEVPYEWTNMLSTIMGIPKLSWEDHNLVPSFLVKSLRS